MTTQSDPTLELIHALDRADPTEWGRIVYGVPIFREHAVYQVDDGEAPDGKPRKRLVVVPKGEAAPAHGECIHTVDKARLEQIAAEVNRNYAEGAKPIKLFVGHSDPAQEQKLNPEIVGYGRRAYVGTFGPQGVAALKTDAFFKAGQETTPADFPERSAEFNPRTNAITGVALLRTDPRLPMGMLAYGEGTEEVLYYGAGFMAAPAKAKPAPAPARPAPVDGQIDDDEDLGDEDQDQDAGQAPAGEQSPATPAQPFAPHEVMFANRLIAHLEQTHPAFKYLCTEHTKYAQSQAALAAPQGTPPAGGMAAPSGTNGFLPGSGGAGGKDPKKKPKPDERFDMSDTADQDRIDYAETKAKLATLEAELAAVKAAHAADQGRIATLETENATLYAEEAIGQLELQGKVIKDKPGEVKKLVALKTMPEREARLAEIKLNYADAERSPARRPGWLPVDAGHPEGADSKDAARAPAAGELLRYAEEHQLDLATDAGMRQALAGLRAAQAVQK